jgi:hypothetical protein
MAILQGSCGCHFTQVQGALYTALYNGVKAFIFGGWLIAGDA